LCGFRKVGDGIEAGGGALWTLNSRFCRFGSASGGVTAADPTAILQFGGAVSF
jgi:hypothetical protein